MWSLAYLCSNDSVKDVDDLHGGLKVRLEKVGERQCRVFGGRISAGNGEVAGVEDGGGDVGVLSGGAAGDGEKGADLYAVPFCLS